MCRDEPAAKEFTMSFSTTNVTGITHDIHVRDESGEIESYNGVLDAMKLPNGTLKFTHEDNLKQVTGGEIVRSRVNGVADAYKYVCPSCESNETALITAFDRGETLALSCAHCDSDKLTKQCL